MSRRVSILGSTGSVGQSTIDVMLAQPQVYDVEVLTACTNAALLAQQAIQLKAKKAVVADEAAYTELKEALAGTGIECASGEDALIEASSIPVDWVMAAIVGMAGLKPLIAAVENAAHVAIANKEPLVAAGSLVMESAKKSGCKILPVDSEHNAIFQVFEEHNRAAIERLILTASGGPFLKASPAELMKATPKQALNHPNWSMGDKISIDSATMMNKALEVIEAHYLFDMPADKIEVLIHPQSVVHSMVEYADGSVLAQMGASDMCTPIANALGWPARIKTPGARLDFASMGDLTFEKVDRARFPSISTAYECLAAGPSACVVLNAANEVAVSAFLEGKIGFVDIHNLINMQLDDLEITALRGIDDILELDRIVRNATESCIVNQLIKTRVA